MIRLFRNWSIAIQLQIQPEILSQDSFWTRTKYESTRIRVMRKMTRPFHAFRHSLLFWYAVFHSNVFERSRIYILVTFLYLGKRLKKIGNGSFLGFDDLCVRKKNFCGGFVCFFCRWSNLYLMNYIVL